MIQELKKDKILIKKGLISSNDEIDIYISEKESTDIEEVYLLTLHGTLNKIGYVCLRLRMFNSYLGNIGYKIDRSYRGNNYALQALKLLTPTMLEKGLTSPIITAYPENIASIKTIENFGGRLISEANEIGNWNTYVVDLSQEEKIVK